MHYQFFKSSYYISSIPPKFDSTSKHRGKAPITIISSFSVIAGSL